MADKSLDFENYRAYSTAPNPTTNAQLQSYNSNQNKLVTELTEQLLWQPSTSYVVGDVVRSKSIPAGYLARCTQAGTSNSIEPTWSGTLITDGGVRWKLAVEALTDAQYEAINSNITAALVTLFQSYGTSKQDTLTGSAAQAIASGITAALVAAYDTHLAARNNPHAVTASQIGAAVAGGHTHGETSWCTAPATSTGAATKAKPVVVVENYRSGQTWYRVWSDGWIEQGGYSNGVNTVFFLKQFASTPLVYLGQYTWGDGSLGVQAASATGFSVGEHDVEYKYAWYACGY